MAVAQHLPQGRCQAGDRHLNFHETRDNLQIGADAALRELGDELVCCVVNLDARRLSGPL